MMAWTTEQRAAAAERMRQRHAERKAQGLPGFAMGHTVSEEGRAKMRAAHARRRAEREAAGFPPGKPHSEESRRKIGEASRRRLRENPRLGEDSPNWKGDEAGYGAIHDWVRRRKPRQGRCEKCGKETRWTDLANIDHRYRRIIEDYIELCRSCHRLMDNERLGRPRKFKPRTHCKKDHELTDENIYIRPGDGARCCRICRRESKRRRTAKMLPLLLPPVP